jgi:hypothetical protein
MDELSVRVWTDAFLKEMELSALLGGSLADVESRIRRISDSASGARQKSTAVSGEALMLGMSARSRTNWDEIDRRLHSVEQSLRHDGRRIAKSMPSTDQVGDLVASVLSTVAERFRGGAISVGDEAAKLGSEAVKYGDYAVRRVSREVAHRPMIALGIAVGVGVLLGLASRR